MNEDGITTLMKALGAVRAMKIRDGKHMVGIWHKSNSNKSRPSEIERENGSRGRSSQLEKRSFHEVGATTMVEIIAKRPHQWDGTASGRFFCYEKPMLRPRCSRARLRHRNALSSLEPLPASSHACSCLSGARELF
jgi:hypothetical protein